MNPERQEAEPTPSRVPAKVLQTLAVQWMQSFETAARTENRAAIMALFSPASLIMGAYKGGPLDEILSKNFHFEANSAKMLPHSPLILFLCSWHAISSVIGGDTRKGDATFYAGIELREDGKKEFRCYHAHFSEITA